MTRRRKLLIVVGVFVLLLGILLAGIRRKVADVSISFRRYRTNVHEVITAEAVITNAGPFSRFVTIRTKVKMGQIQPWWVDQERSGSFSPNASTIVECSPPCPVIVEYRKEYHHDYPDTLSEQLQFWLDRYILRCDRRTNVYTLRLDIP